MPSHPTQPTACVEIFEGSNFLCDFYLDQGRKDAEKRNLGIVREQSPFLCEAKVTNDKKFKILNQWLSRAAIQRRGSILAWTVILSVYGADTIAIDLSLSALISWFMKSIIGFFNNSNLHAIIYICLIINFHWVNKIFCCIRRNW